MAEPIDFNKYKKDGFTKGPIGPGGTPPPPPNFPNPSLPQILYQITLVDKITGGEVIHLKRGHIVVTASNIVLFDGNQEMIWGIPNDDFVISFERIDEFNNEVEEAIWEEAGSSEVHDPEAVLEAEETGATE